jgi:hypothetical protein
MPPLSFSSHHRIRVVRGGGNHARAGAGRAASNLAIYSTCAKSNVAVTQADVFDYFRNQRKIRVNYIVRLPVS